MHLSSVTNRFRCGPPPQAIDRRALKISTLVLFAPMAFADFAHAQEAAKEVVATAVRQRGYVCEKPESVRPDPESSSPDEKAWLLQCETGSFRVKFMGDTGTKVEPVKD